MWNSWASEKGLRCQRANRQGCKDWCPSLWNNGYYLQGLVGEIAEPDIPAHGHSVEQIEDAEDAASRLRERWEIGTDPIVDLTNVLEHRSVHVLAIDA